MASEEGETELQENEDDLDTAAEESPLDFEERFRRLLHSMGLADIDGGTKCKFADHQIDALGGVRDHLLVFDCTIKKGNKATAKRLTAKIEQWRGKHASLVRALNEDPIYSKYPNVSIVIAANATVADVDRKYASQHQPVIHILGKQNIEYLSEIADDIGPYAGYRLTSLLGLQLHRQPSTVPALRVTDEGKVLYLFAEEAKSLAELAFVPQAEAGFRLFYQRLVKKGKIRAISQYVQVTKRPFPNSIILAIARAPKFEPIEKSGDEADAPVVPGTLHLPSEYGSCWVVDGQHRIYGSALSTRASQLVTTLIPANDLDKARYFLEINSNQTKIDSDLKWDLRARLIPDDAEGRISLACQKLDELESPIKGHVKIPHLGMGKARPIKLSGLCDAVLKNRIHELHQYKWSENDFVDSLSTDIAHWLREVDAKVSDERLKERFIFDNSGLSVLLIIFKRISKKLEHDRPTLAQLMQYADRLSEWLRQLDPSESSTLAQRCSSEAGRAEVADRAVAAMNDHLPANSQLEIAGRATKLSATTVDFEVGLRRRLNELFCECLGGDWFAHTNFGGSAVRPPAGPDDLTLGHLTSLLRRDEFWKCVEHGFQKNNLRKELAIDLLQYVTDYRNAIHHGHQEKAHKFDDRLVENAISTLRRCLVIA